VRARLHRHRVALLVAGALLGVGGALATEVRVVAASTELVGPPAPTPVLSVRRLPEALAAPTADRRLRADLLAWAAVTPSSSCALIHDEDGEVVLDLRAHLPLVPASTLKLATATAALLELGAEARFRTAAVGTPPVDGVVTGDLTVVGGGDPLLATSGYAARFKRQPQTFTDAGVLAQRLVDAGVRRVTGSVVGDESRYDRVRYVPAWPLRYIDQDVTGPLSALAVNDGFAAYPSTWDAGDELVQAEDPAAQAATVLTAELEIRGVDVVGAPRSGLAPEGAAELAAVESPPLEDVVTQLLRESDNSTAELLLKELGRAAADPSTAGGRAQATEALQDAGLDLTGALLADGSGLGLDNRATCRLLVDLLERPGTGAVLRAGLPVAAESGTLTERFVGTSLAGHLRAKTGSLNTVASLTGLLTDEDGTFTFAYIVNAEPGRGAVDEQAVIASQLALGEILLGWPRVPEVEALGPLEPAGPEEPAAQ
jgi:D-alanyl-D-alanine carboxypeptidase/D-alanyl-D-alanine-endopeptidase (penicillin-binding protein 4)